MWSFLRTSWRTSWAKIWYLIKKRNQDRLTKNWCLLRKSFQELPGVKLGIVLIIFFSCVYWQGPPGQSSILKQQIVILRSTLLVFVVCISRNVFFLYSITPPLCPYPPLYSFSTNSLTKNKILLYFQRLFSYSKFSNRSDSGVLSLKKQKSQVIFTRERNLLEIRISRTVEVFYDV